MDNLLDESIVNSIIERQKSHDTPLEKDKIQLVKTIQKLSKEDHMKIFEILQKLEKKIYTTNEKETLFDVNDLKTESFWEIFLYSVLSYRNNIYKDIISSANKEKIEKEKYIQNKFEKELKDQIALRIHMSNKASNISGLNRPEYEELRTKALFVSMPN